MPGKVIDLKCNNCEAHYHFQFGGDIRSFKDLSEYNLLSSKLRSRKKLNLTGNIEEVFLFGLRQCPSCFNLIQTHHTRVRDESGNVQESKTRTKCPNCRAGTREINLFGEDITWLPCPNCKTESLSEDEMGSILWD